MKQRGGITFFVLIYNLTKQPFLYIIKTPKHDVDFSRVDLFSPHDRLFGGHVAIFISVEKTSISSGGDVRLE